MTLKDMNPQPTPLTKEELAVCGKMGITPLEMQEFKFNEAREQDFQNRTGLALNSLKNQEILAN